ncbi:unnamed protein product, partial [Rotaria magnacalcarata]
MTINSYNFQRKSEGSSWSREQLLTAHLNFINSK